MQFFCRGSQTNCHVTSERSQFNRSIGIHVNAWNSGNVIYAEDASCSQTVHYTEQLTSRPFKGYCTTSSDSCSRSPVQHTKGDWIVSLASESYGWLAGGSTIGRNDDIFVRVCHGLYYLGCVACNFIVLLKRQISYQRLAIWVQNIMVYDQNLISVYYIFNVW